MAENCLEYDANSTFRRADLWLDQLREVLFYTEPCFWIVQIRIGTYDLTTFKKPVTGPDWQNKRIPILPDLIKYKKIVNYNSLFWKYAYVVAPVRSNESSGLLKRKPV